MDRFFRTITVMVLVVTAPIAGAVWSGSMALDIASAGLSRELVFTEVMLGVLSSALSVLLTWLAAAALAGSVDAARLLGSRRQPGGGTTAAARSRRGASAVAAAVTTLVLLAAGMQSASAAPVAGTPSAAVGHVAAPPAEDPVDSVATAAEDAVDRVAPMLVGGWTPQVSAMTPRTAALVVGSPVALTPEHVVVRGESLWAIAAQHLGEDATVGEISAQWRLWWQANHDVIGDDPDVLLVGQILHPPA